MKFYIVINMVEDFANYLQQKSMKLIQPALKKKYHILAGAGLSVTMIMIVKMIREHKRVISNIVTQGSEHSTPLPDKNFVANMWLKPEIMVPPCSTKAMTSTNEQVVDMLKNIIVIAMLSNEKGGCSTNMRRIQMLPIKGNVYLINYHSLFDNKFKYIAVVRSLSMISNNRECELNETMWKRIGNTDLALVCLPAMGDNRDITHLFPLRGTKFNSDVVTWINKNKELQTRTYITSAIYQPIKFYCTRVQTHFAYQAWHFDLDDTTTDGMCGSPIVSNGVRPLILGCHSAGDDRGKRVVAHAFVYEDIMETYQEMFARTIGDTTNINTQCASTSEMQLSFPKYDIKHLGSIHKKSPFNFHEVPSVVLLYGAHTGVRRRFRSAVEPTYISESVSKHLGLEPAHGPPMNMGNYKPWHADSVKASRDANLSHEPLRMAYADYELTIFDFLENHHEYKDLICPMSRVATLSGVDACRGIDAIKLSTSAGFPRCKPKRNYVFEDDEVHEFITRPLNVSDEIWAEVDRLSEVLKRGERVYFIHRINLKDEPIALGKEKVRTFAGCSLECLILVRMYYLPIAKMMMDNPEIFECAVGVNAHGPEWTKLTEHMQKHGIDRTVAGDYKDYDLRVWCVLTLLAFELLIAIAKWAGYSEAQLTIMRGLATELCYGLTEYNGEYAMFLGRNLSGHPLTVFINNLVNCMYMRYSYYDIWLALSTNDQEWINGMKQMLQKGGMPNCDYAFDQWAEKFMKIHNEKYPPRFADVVSLMCYGDDNKMSVSEDIKFFNHTTIKYSLGRQGVEYTMADKTTESIPFINATECSFLKRHSVWNEEFQQYLGPLELKSLQKTLHSCVASKVITKQQQAAEALDSVIRELFYHGEEVFNSWRDKLQLVLAECELEPYFKTRALHTYDFLKSEYIRKYLSDSDIKNNSASNSIDEIAKTEVLRLVTQCADITNINPHVYASLIQGNDAYLGMCSPAQKFWPHTFYNSNAYVVIQWINDNNKQNMVMGPDTHENVVFRDGTEQWNVEMNGFYDDTRKVGMDQTTSLEDFFRRPVKYNLPDWQVGSVTPYTSVFDPWTVFFTNPRVSNRISNFRLLQCTLKVKFMINGNPFYYGRLLADYAPLKRFRNIEKFDTLNSSNIVPASQRMHIYLNPTSSQGGELHLPFVHPRNALDITTGMWADMGDIHVRELTPLKHANGAVQDSSISCYIWAENVVVSIPTTVNASGITTQGAMDEYMSKPISNIASTIADVANRLTSIPVIGPYMRATQMMSSSVSSVAKLFGFSRPVQIENSMINKPRLISSLAVTDVGDMVQKLTVDSKQELSIDPKIVGLDVGDELVLHKIACKESYFSSFTWPTTLATDAFLWNTRVHPMNSVQDITTTKTTWRLPACAYAALPFSAWRGTMRYRFQIVASDYHRGRLRFVWDPVAPITAESNIVFTRIVDLCDERDFVIDIAWGQTQSYLDVAPPGIEWQRFGTTPYTTGASNLSNGVLSLFVLNELTTPNSSVNNDIRINVFVSMCDDAEFANPSAQISAIQYNTQAEEGEMAYDHLVNAPVIDEPTDNILPCLVKDHTNDVYYGEKITSLRQLLKRYTLHNSILCPTPGEGNWLISMPDFPVYRGTFNYGFQLNAVAAAANINRTSMLQYVGAAFLAKRGGVRYKYMYNTDKPTNQNYISVSRLPLTNSPVQQSGVTAYDVTNSTAFSTAQQAQRAASLYGIEITPITQQPIIEFEGPNYSVYRFGITQNAASAAQASAANFGMYANRHQVCINNTSTARSYVDIYVAGAEDLTFVGFQGCPPISFDAV